MASGALVKGSTNAAFLKKNLSSMPAKYETVVYVEEKKKGFGSNSERFFGSYFGRTDASISQDEKPGPGSYISNLNHMVRQSDSLSRKGLGNGFISKVDRFHDSKLYYSKFMPGPGSYVGDSFIGGSTQTSFMPSVKYKN
mmetsp:Transcript_6310/g.4754  ORF Transcript_6310/g.4754 Transcript_6310/m.4754 type:complete len:140 (+) Transcript_6310:154-573(+)